jgi:acyl-CoA thioester hydrolase
MAFETDFYGVVSNTRYLEYLERGRYGLLERAGVTVKDIWEEHGVQPIVRRVAIEYLGPARHEDHLQLVSWVELHEGATTTLRHELFRCHDQALILTARQMLAYINRHERPVRVPPAYRLGLPAAGPDL